MKQTTTECRHCCRQITDTDQGWKDPQATGDDRMWQFTCEGNDTFTAEHQPIERAEQ